MTARTALATLGLALASAMAVAQGVAPGGPIGGSTGIGSGLGGVTGTGPSWPNGTNQAPQPSVPSVPPGGYASPAPSTTYAPRPAPSLAGPSTRPSPNPRPIEPFATSTPRPPASIPLQLPERPSGSLVFLKGCWRTDNFPYGQHRGTTTWCFDDKGGGRYLYARTDQPNVFFCHGQAQVRWEGTELRLNTRPACDDGSAVAPGELTCRDGTDGALCSDPAKSWTVRLYRVR